MPENMKVLASRRAYEFHADDLRLSTLSMKPVQAQILTIRTIQEGKTSNYRSILEVIEAIHATFSGLAVASCLAVSKRDGKQLCSLEMDDSNGEHLRRSS